MSPESDSHDAITFTPDRIKIIRDKDEIKTLYDPNHGPIIRALRKGPMTVRELEEAYKKEAKIKEELEAKTDKTIYRYLKELKDANLVIEAGKRVKIGKTATESLFSRTAEAFIVHDIDEEHWDCDDGKAICKIVGLMLEKSLGEKSLDEKCMKQFMIDFDKEINTQVVAVLEGADEALLDLFASVDWKHKDKVLFYFGCLSAVIHKPKLLEQLKGCYK
jgi:DNA-binding transcriptional ArsR family regulator